VILPTKGISADRALLSIGADILRMLDEAKTVSRVWDEVRSSTSLQRPSSTLSFDWFVLALDLLYILGIVELEQGRLVRRAAASSSESPNPGASFLKPMNR
jgi:hypothetical protein